MHLIADNTTRKAALNTIRELIATGLAGNDVYQPETFIVDAPTRELRDHAEIALDILGGVFLKDNRAAVRVELPTWVRAELGLDRPGAPELTTPLASRALPVSRTECFAELAGVYPPQAVDLIMSTVFGPDGLNAGGHVGDAAREAANRTRL